MKQDHDFRDRLVSAQQFTPQYREEYERKLKNMLTRQLTPPERARLAFSALIGTVALPYYGYLLASNRNVAVEMKVVFILLTCAALYTGILKGIAAVRGTLNARIEPKIIASVAFFGIVVFVAATLWVLPSGAVHTTHMLMLGLFALIVAAVKFLQMHITQSELNVREKMLEIELKLTDMNEKLNKRQ